MSVVTSTKESGSQNRSLQNRAVLGVSLMILGLALYPLSDAFIKHLMGTYSFQQTSFLRALTRLIPLLFATFLQGGPFRILYTALPGKHAVRLAVNLLSTCLFIAAFSKGSLTVVYTLGYTAPLFVILLSAFMLKEKVSPERWAAVALGMVGVIIAMRPTAGMFEWVAIVVLIGTFLAALNKILMRRLAATEHSLAIAIYPNITMILAMTPILFTTWQSMPWAHWGLFAFAGGLAAIGQYSITQAVRFAQASTLAPIDYSSFFWVVSLDFLWWDKTPDIFTILGASVIVGSNLFILYKTRCDEAAKVAA